MAISLAFYKLFILLKIPLALDSIFIQQAQIRFHWMPPNKKSVVPTGIYRIGEAIFCEFLELYLGDLEGIKKCAQPVFN
jgi:hypothetical protein